MINPINLIKPKRTITGMSAIVLPFQPDGMPDWKGFTDHLKRTITAGLIPAVSMDTGFVSLINDETKRSVLRRTKEIMNGKQFIAGVFVNDHPGDGVNINDYHKALGDTVSAGAIPVIMQSYGLSSLTESDIPDAYRKIAKDADTFIAFELGKQFAAFGRIYELSTYEEIMKIPSCIGAKHSSLSRQLEWDRIELRNRVRPDFKVLTGNDLAIDMVMYGSDYLLGLSTFAPDLFAYRDQLWQKGDSDFFELNDLLQYLGMFAFRNPVPGYKHNALQFLMLQGFLSYDGMPIGADKRPDSDRLILQDIIDTMKPWRERIC